MPYSNFLIPDRRAVGQVTYQLRRFAGQLKAMEIPEPYKNVLIEDVYLFEEKLKRSVLDFDDDGSVLEGSPDNLALLNDPEDLAKLLIEEQVREQQHKIDSLKAQIEHLEALRPHWAHGHSSDGVAAQVSVQALNQLWNLLNVSDQTAAVMKLKEITGSEE